MTPRIAYEQGLILTGEREHRHIAYDENFILATYPTTSKSTAKIQAGRGIKLHYLYYWSEAFRNPEIEGTSVPVRYDPFDVSVAYAYVQGRWVKCISQYYSIFEGRTEKELVLAAQEMKQQAKLTNRKIVISALRLADFLHSVQKHEALLLQRLRDLEGKNVLNALALEPTTKSSVRLTSTQIFPLSSYDSPITFSEVKTQSIPPKVELSSLPIFEEYR
ncbi:Mu transposase C-terminal domain-containing protein [Gloeothece verrucosa]|uniref:Mu transposase C-terminal domain-containing protein n=1 Tax=Gloeothece verrucosa TaxID=2546359 RepID=UPI00017E240A|nr:Mu transposase C-terminal domain-containing protein [Gloeothece verrucosa]